MDQKIGSYVGRLKNTFSSFQKEVSSMTENLDVEKNTANKKETKKSKDE